MWIKHDDKGYPFESINAVCDIVLSEVIFLDERAENWEWDEQASRKIIAYRFVREEDYTP
jgi:hypothetical protein